VTALVVFPAEFVLRKNACPASAHCSLESKECLTEKKETECPPPVRDRTSYSNPRKRGKEKKEGGGEEGKKINLDGSVSVHLHWLLSSFRPINATKKNMKRTHKKKRPDRTPKVVIT